MSLAGLPATDGARLNGDEPQMIFVAGAAWLHEAKAVDPVWLTGS
jgi:hypothetical protein